MWGHGYDGMMGGAGFGVMWALWILILVGIAALVFAVVRLASKSRDGGTTPPPATTSSARAILEERYARGDIDTEEFTERKKNLEGR
ncbi:SHOCT domain-containing protein [Demequina sp. TTPB684]|nr:SHOCT domain-containing protein [Demequina sp. TTPB684]MCB2412687.1 SHOCT domain-containing protein [Demequina sp. TTPB684]